MQKDNQLCEKHTETSLPEPLCNVDPTATNKSLCQLALENPHDTRLHRVLAYAYRTADDKYDVMSTAEYKATGATSVTDPTSRRGYYLQLGDTIIEVFIRNAGLPGID